MRLVWSERGEPEVLRVEVFSQSEPLSVWANEAKETTRQRGGTKEAASVKTKVSGHSRSWHRVHPHWAQWWTSPGGEGRQLGSVLADLRGRKSRTWAGPGFRTGLEIVQDPNWSRYEPGPWFIQDPVHLYFFLMWKTKLNNPSPNVTVRLEHKHADLYEGFTKSCKMKWGFF